MVALCLLIVVCACASPQKSNLPLGRRETKIFNKKIGPEVQAILDGAPRRDPPSPEETRREIEVVRKLQERSDDNLADIRKELTANGIVESFNPPEHVVDDLMKKLVDIVEPVVIKIKVEYNRTRPSHIDKSIKPSIDVPEHPSYPSGHATQAHFVAHQLSKQFPEHKDRYESNAHRMAQNREIAGVHYPSDSAYGKVLGEFISASL